MKMVMHLSQLQEMAVSSCSGRKKKLRKALDSDIVVFLNSHLIISILWQHRQWIFSVLTAGQYQSF